MGNLIERSTWKVVGVDTDDNDVAWEDFVSIRVILYITKPLMHGKKLDLSFRNICWVRLSYARIPNFCYCCEKLDHDLRML